MKLSVRDLVGEYGITLDDGQEVYNLIHPEIVAGHRVEVDFAGVEVVASPFLNAAFGQLLRDTSPEALNRLLKVSNLMPAGVNAFRRVTENAKQYYASKSFRKALDEVMAEQAEG